MGKIWKIAAVVAATIVLVRAETAEAMDVGALAEVRQNVYGVPPEGQQAVKRKGDAVVFKETLETLDESSALIRFIDDSKLRLGAKSKVVIDEFVFDPKNVKGNALIELSVGTLRFVTGEMPKGGVVIKTPTATLTLRGTDVVVHVHPDGTTDTTVHDGKVEAHNNVTNQVTNLAPGDGATLGQDGTSNYDHDDDPDIGTDNGNVQSNDPPEHRRGDSSQPERAGTPEPAGDSGDDGDDDGDYDGGCGCI
jgi:hypothetical protein